MRSGRSTMIFVAAILVGSGVVFSKLVIPRLDEVDNAKRAVALAHEQLTREEEASNGFQDLNAAVDRNADAVVRLDRAIPAHHEKPTDVPELMLLFQDIAEREAGGVILQSIQVTAIEPAGVLSKAGGKKKTVGIQTQQLLSREVSLTGFASYDGLKRFLQAAALSLRLTEPVQLSFSTPSEQTQSIVTFSATFRVFLQSP